MDSKIYSLVITSILAFALIVGIPKTFEMISKHKKMEPPPISLQGEIRKGLTKIKEMSGIVHGQFNG
jgi:hypothetical protein